MPKRSNDFQQLVYAIQSSGSKDALVTESKLLVDRQTGAKTEVDIVIETETNDYNVVISIEVRARNRPATVEWVREMLGKHSTLPTNKLVLISKSGFTKEAIDKAKENDIETLSFEEANLFDWSTKIKYFIEKGDLYIAAFNMKATEFKINFLEKIATDIQQDQQLISPNDIFYIPSLSESSTISNLPGAMLRSDNVAIPIMNKWIKEGKESFTITWTPTTNCHIENKEGIKFPIKEIIVSGKCEVERIPLKLESGALKNAQVAHATIPNIFDKEEKSGNVTVSLIEKENKKLEGVLVIPASKKSPSQVKHMKFPEEKLINKKPN